MRNKKLAVKNEKLEVRNEKFYLSLLTSNFLFLILFVVALIPRVIGLDRFITTDEAHNIFSASSEVITALLRGDLRGTYWHFYPGVTISWLTSLGLIGQYLLAPLTGHNYPPFSTYLYSNITQLLVAVHLPYAILTAAAVPVIYLLTRRLLPEPVALLGALFVAFDPFYLAHSRVVHGDAPVTVFMLISTLAIYNSQLVSRSVCQPVSPSASQLVSSSAQKSTSHLSFLISNYSLLTLSAICGGLAALTKAPGQFMAPFVILLTVLYIAIDYRKNILISHFSFLTFWGFISLVTFIILWPAMWVAPITTIERMVSETFSKVDEGHLVYFFGQPTLNPGVWFYPYVTLFRLTPVTLLGLGLAFIGLIATIKRTTPHVTILRLLWFFVISLLLFGELSPKKQDRYLLPLFPFIDLLAAIGWYGLLEFMMIYTGVRNSLRAVHKKLWTPTRITFIAYTLLFLIHLYPTISYYPYYLTYFNPLMGGPARAAETVLMGWGEGMEQAAAYLNTKPNAAQLYVASTPSQTLLPYFVGTGENFYTNDIAWRADYVVLYLAQRQRLAPSPEIVRYYEAQSPEKIISIQGVPYIYIYRNTKRILTDIPPTAMPLNIGLENIMRLAGYQLSATSTITLYWHALAPIKTDYTISLRALAADNRRLAQQDSWPLNGLLPTTQWRPGDTIADTHTLELSAPDQISLTHFEIVVYNTATNTPLGPPIIIKK